MPVRITPRRSVKIEAWDATKDDLLRVQTHHHKPTYYFRTETGGFGDTKPQIFFDPEFVPDDVAKLAQQAAKSELIYSRKLGLNHPFSGIEPSDEEIEQEYDFMLKHSGRLYQLDYDLILELDFIYYMNQRVKWVDANPVQHIAWVTREQARKEREETQK